MGREKGLPHKNVPLIPPTWNPSNSVQICSGFDTRISFKDLVLVGVRDYMRWIRNKPIGAQVFMLDGWEVISFVHILACDNLGDISLASLYYPFYEKIKEKKGCVIRVTHKIGFKPESRKVR